MNIKTKILRLKTALLLCCLPLSLSAYTLTEEEKEEWLFDDSDILSQDVNEGQLEFLVKPPKKIVHHHHNSIVITPQSLKDGWVQLKQCHANLDKVPALQIVFNKERIRNLRVVEQKNVAQAWATTDTIQLRHISAEAKLCLSAEVKTLTNNQDGTYSMASGPYMRRFLDGFYPMRVSADVKLDTRDLCLAALTPDSQQGFEVWNEERTIHYNAWFEGKLYTNFTFFSLFNEDQHRGNSKNTPIHCDRDEVVASTG